MKKMPQLIVMTVVCFIVFYFPVSTAGQEIKDCKSKMKHLIRQSPNIVVAEVTKVYEAPGSWSSSSIFSYQRVLYKAGKSIKGARVPETLLVHHAVIENSPLVDRTGGRLSPSLFVAGSRFILFLIPNEHLENPNKPKMKNYLVTDSDCGVVKYSDEVMDAINELISSGNL
ncbi:MAG: hypothetical protein IPM21_14890 [Acidobacteria bacterium]|nr:hypothetical protein [Acidobacteriota bacterium]